MAQNGKTKNIINILIGIVVVGGLGFGAFYLFGGGGEGGPSVTPGVGGISPEAAQLVQLLSTLERIELDHTIVERPDFISLTNIRIAIPTEPVGTTRPFDAL
tara:strand:- start:406 stop:711 length:306 start_codon:yes stop_codon:yes gene_type:complete